jgi:hypothetical protein
MPYWAYTKSVGSLVLDGLTIVCGGDEFVPYGSKWLDTTSLYVFDTGTKNAPNWEGFPAKKPHVCDNAAAWTLLGRSDIQNPIDVAGEKRIGVLILCKSAIEKLRNNEVPDRSEHPQLEAASLAMVQRQGKLERGQQISKSLSHVWSATLLHEVFHYVLDEESKYL